MKLFLDAADTNLIRRWVSAGVVAGVTTNPRMLQSAGMSEPPKLLELVKATAPLPICLQVLSTRADDVVSDGLRLVGLGTNVVVKVPVVQANGTSMLHAIHELSEAGVPVNATACLSIGQAILAAEAGAAYVSVLAGRIEDEGGDAATAIRMVRLWVDDAQSDTRIVAASLRRPGDMTRLLLSRPDIFTVPPLVLEQLADHRYARATAAELVGDQG